MTLSRPEKPSSVLLVDDSFLMRKLLAEIISRDPDICLAGEASDGLEGLDKLSQLLPDVVLLDMEMPRLDGIGFLERARFVCTARIIVVSSVAMLGTETARRAMELGAYAIVGKPSGVLSMDMAEERGQELLDAIHGSMPSAHREGRTTQ